MGGRRCSRLHLQLWSLVVPSDSAPVATKGVVKRVPIEDTNKCTAALRTPDVLRSDE